MKHECGVHLQTVQLIFNKAETVNIVRISNFDILVELFLFVSKKQSEGSKFLFISNSTKTVCCKILIILLASIQDLHNILNLFSILFLMVATKY